MINFREQKYRHILSSMPASGGGGCHTALLSVASYGKHAGMLPEQIYKDIRSHVHGSRKVSNGEIITAIKKAFQESGINNQALNYSVKKQAEKYSNEQIHDYLQAGLTITEDYFAEKSAVKFDSKIENQKYQFLEYLYAKEDIVFIGNIRERGEIGSNIKSVSDWLATNITANFYIPNPLTGRAGLTKDNKETYRADSTVKSFRYCVVEFDKLTHQQQLAFWYVTNLDCVALIDSGNKSIHGLVRLQNIESQSDWTVKVKQELYQQELIKYGADMSCSHPARLSRLPGILRTDKNSANWQRIIYLNKNRKTK